MTYWFLSCIGTSPSVVLARPHSFNHSVLPAFYSSLLLACRSLDGSVDDRLSSLVFASRDPHARRVVADLSSKIGYLFLLDENYAVPHCVEKFRPTFGALYWPSTWRQLTSFCKFGPFSFGLLLEGRSWCCFDCPASYILWLACVSALFLWSSS